MIIYGYWASFEGDNNVLKFILVMVAELVNILKVIELYTLNGHIVHELYFNKVVKNRCDELHLRQYSYSHKVLINRKSQLHPLFYE